MLPRAKISEVNLIGKYIKRHTKITIALPPTQRPCLFALKHDSMFSFEILEKDEII